MIKNKEEQETLPEGLRQKVYTRDAARRKFGEGREHRLVFTNGCFDIVHRGHVADADDPTSIGEQSGVTYVSR